MKRLVRIGVTVLWLVPVMGTVLAADLSSPSSPEPASDSAPLQLAAAGDAPARSASAGTPDLDKAWKDVRAFVRQGQYRDALQVLEMILSANPDDARAKLYAALCRTRLEQDTPFVPLDRGELRALEQTLKDEARQEKQERKRRKQAAKRIEQEQKRWDRELVQLDETERAEAARRREAERVKAQESAAAERARMLQRAKELVPEPGTAPTGTVGEGHAEPAGRSASEEDRSSVVFGQPEDGSVEMQPVKIPVTASLREAKRVPPPGAVQIDARLMSVSPDRRLARAEGNVEVIYGDALLTCDRVTFFTDTKDVYAEGNVRLEDGDTVMRGEIVHYNFDTKKGRFLEGAVATPPWHQHGRSIEALAEGIYQVSPGDITSCDLEPPHFRLAARRAIVFTEDRVARARHVGLFVGKLPFLYLPGVVLADRQTPFFIVPGRRKPWQEFALGGYRYEWPENHKGILHADWRRTFGWGFGLDHQFESQRFGQGLLKVYYNDQGSLGVPDTTPVTGADEQRYRLLWRHRWMPLPDTSLVTDIQEYSDAEFRRDFLFREEFVEEDAAADPGSFISMVRNDPNFTLTALMRKRMNRFDAVTEAFPDAELEVREQPIGDTNFYSRTTFGAANLQTKTPHSDLDTDVVRADWWQQIKYAMNWFRPVLMTPNASVRQTYYTKDIQSGPAGGRFQGERDVVAGQFTAGTDASVKFFKVMPVTTNWLGLDINQLRHVLSPTVTYGYVHEPTVVNSLLSFPTASEPSNVVTLGLENKLQTKRVISEGRKPQSVDLARALLSVPYEFHGRGQEQGGEMGDWAVDIELFPWQWMRLETDWIVPSHFDRRERDTRIRQWNLDMVIVGGQGNPMAQNAAPIQAPSYSAFQPGPQAGITLLPQGQWYLGLGHRYSQNDKTEGVLQFDWRLSDKWQIGTFHRITWKEVALGVKRLNHLREYQYTLRRDLHDWIGELAFRVDSEFGTEIFFTLTLKAYPLMPIEMETSYRQPKAGSRYSPFSPARNN